MSTRWFMFMDEAKIEYKKNSEEEFLIGKTLVQFDTLVMINTLRDMREKHAGPVMLLFPPCEDGKHVRCGAIIERDSTEFKRVYLAKCNNVWSFGVALKDNDTDMLATFRELWNGAPVPCGRRQLKSLILLAATKSIVSKCTTTCTEEFMTLTTIYKDLNDMIIYCKLERTYGMPILDLFVMFWKKSDLIRQEVAAELSCARILTASDTLCIKELGGA